MLVMVLARLCTSVGWEDRKGCSHCGDWLFKVAQRHQGRKERMKTSPKIIRDAGMRWAELHPHWPLHPKALLPRGGGSWWSLPRGGGLWKDLGLFLAQISPSSNKHISQKVSARKIHIPTQCSSARTQTPVCRSRLSTVPGSGRPSSSSNVNK